MHARTRFILLVLGMSVVACGAEAPPVSAGIRSSSGELTGGDTASRGSPRILRRTCGRRDREEPVAYEVRL